MTFKTPKLTKISFQIQTLTISILAGIKTATITAKTSQDSEIALRAQGQSLIDALMRSGKGRVISASVSRQKSKNIIISLS